VFKRLRDFYTENSDLMDEMINNLSGPES